MITITHTHAEGTLIEGTERGDGSNAVLKRSPWRCRWSRNLGCWYVPQSRDRDGRQLEGLADALRESGFDVELHESNERRSIAEREEDREERDQVLAERHADRAQARAATARGAFAAEHEILDRIPPGQPILVGHHSERGHRRDLARADGLMRRGLEASREAEGYANRAQSAQARVERRDDPAYVQNRIDEAEAELRRAQRGHRYVDGSGVKVFASEVETAEETVRYWHEQMERIRGTGRRVFTRADISKGDAVKIRHGWGRVERVNPKTVSVMVGMPWPLKYKYAEIRGHRTAAQLAEAAAKGETEEAA